MSKHLPSNLLICILVYFTSANCFNKIIAKENIRLHSLLIEAEKLKTSDSLIPNYAQRILTIARETNDSFYEIQAFRLLANHHLAAKNDKLGFKLMTKAWVNFTSLKHKPSMRGHKIDIVQALADNYFRSNSTDSLITLVSKALKHAENTKDTILLANTLNLNGVYYYKLGQFYNSIDFFKRAVTFYKIKKLHSQTAKTLFNMGLLFKRHGDFDKSIKHFLEAIPYFEGDSLRLEKGKCLNSIGSVYRDLYEQEKAFEYQSKALEEFKNLSDSLYISVALNSMGLTLNSMLKPDTALILLYQSLSIKQNLKQTKLVSTALHNIGFVYTKINSDSAFFYFSKSESLKKKLNDQYGLASLYNDISELSISQENLAHANNYLQLSREISKMINAQQILLRNYQLSKEWALVSNNVKSALFFSEKHDSLSSLLFQTEKHKIAEELEAKYQNRQKKHEIFIKNAQLLTRTKQLSWEKKIRFFLIMVVALSLVSLSILILFFKQRKRNLKIQAEKKTIEAKLDGEEDERQRIAETLHDDIAGILVGASNILNQLSEDHQNIPLLEKVRLQVQSTYESIRLSSHQLAPFYYFGGNLIQGLQEFFFSIQQGQNLKIDFIHSDIKQIIVLQQQTQLFIYRTLQELTINSFKHSKASNLSIYLGLEVDTVKLIISDDGIGIDKSNKPGIGILNLKKRIKANNGSILIESKKNEGTTFQITLMPS